MGVGAQERVSKRVCGAASYGDIQDPSKCLPAYCRVPALADVLDSMMP